MTRRMVLTVSVLLMMFCLGEHLFSAVPARGIGACGCYNPTNECKVTPTTCVCPSPGGTCPEDRREKINDVVRFVDGNHSQANDCYEHINEEIICYKDWDCVDGGNLNCTVPSPTNPSGSCRLTGGSLLHTETISDYWMRRGDCNASPCEGTSCGD
ncbi:MAG: hypothetical protein KJ057_07195 [Phycisphaerae bacterium]|nr:MAG: hypothetical protein F9K17_07970 [Phycisphaerae bacterium]MBE7457065.1 hypothetical protein [Planctomycetia bacterium]MCK6463577.1 hypothetical protein [Phycisphaerae bacterium]MCL4718245.1 hypothetical protein [Phycisphaerae bacterium]NUQ07847.1 hypothetical protein [Phycisphaerae bacterium]